MSKRKNKIQICLIAILLFAILVTGCNKKNNEEQTSVKGRYVETEVTLPEEIKDAQLIKMQQSDKNLPVIYVVNENGKGVSIDRYELLEDNTWSKESPEWLQNIELQDEDKLESPKISIDNIFKDKDGNEYLTYGEYNGYTGLTYLCMTTNGKERTYIELEDWNQPIKDDQGIYYNCPTGITVLDNGDILAGFNQEVTIYDKDTKKKKITLPCEERDLTNSTVVDNKLYFARKDENGTYITGVSEINLEDTKPVCNEFAYNGNMDSYVVQLDCNENGDLILLDMEGIHVLKEGTSIWNTVVIGELNTMYMPSAQAIGMYQDKEENYYVLYQMDDMSSYLAKYIYDKDVVSMPSKNVVVYTLSDDMVLREAAVEYNKSNPDVMITIEQTSENEDSIALDEKIKSLNTQILAGEGPDILVTDDLPADSYISKGALLDMNDIIQPMIDSGELLTNVIKDYQIDNHIYTVPTRIQPYIVIGKTETVKECTTLDGLINASKKEWNKSLIGQITPQDLIATVLPTRLGTIMKVENGKKSIVQEELIAFLEKAKELYDHVDGVEEYTDGQMVNMFALPSEAQVIVQRMEIWSMDLDMAVKNLINGSLLSYENAYMGVMEIGINANTKYPDVAKDFLKLLLSEKMQSKNYTIGAAINSKAINTFIENDVDSVGYTDIIDEEGNMVPFEIKGLSKSEREELANIYRMVDNRAIKNDKVTEVVQTQFTNMIKDDQSVEDCAKAIVEELHIYLSE